jgi:hypothetical protein
VSGSGTGCAIVQNGRQPGFELVERRINFRLVARLPDGVRFITAAVMDVGHAAERDQVLRGGAQDGLEFSLRLVVLTKIEERPPSVTRADVYEGWCARPARQILTAS